MPLSCTPCYLFDTVFIGPLLFWLFRNNQYHFALLPLFMLFHSLEFASPITISRFVQSGSRLESGLQRRNSTFVDWSVDLSTKKLSRNVMQNECNHATSYSLVLTMKLSMSLRLQFVDKMDVGCTYAVTLRC